MTKYIEVPCEVCGKLYWQVSGTWGRRLTCSDECNVERAAERNRRYWQIVRSTDADPSPHAGGEA